MHNSDDLLRLYKDGLLVMTSTAITPSALGSCLFMSVGGLAHAAGTDMAAAHCAWWENRTLTLAEIQLLARV